MVTLGGWPASQATLEPMMHETVINNYYGGADPNDLDQIPDNDHDKCDDQSQHTGYGGNGFDSGGDSHEVCRTPAPTIVMVPP